VTFGPTDDERRVSRRVAFVAGLTDLSRKMCLHVEVVGGPDLALHDELSDRMRGILEWDHERGTYEYHAQGR
jgi:hypothetical protein